LADESRTIRKKKCYRKSNNGNSTSGSSKRRRSPSSPLSITEERSLFPLQRLYMSCVDVFKGVGTVPSPSDVQKLCRILDEQAVMSGEESKRYWWLEEIEVPKESEMEGIEYMGPQIIETSYPK
nr:plant cysteine oxidase 2-like [Tanacetum cinerariifolium]